MPNDKPMEEWQIYKNYNKIGQARTWGQALENLIKQDALDQVRISVYTGLILVHDENNKNVSYKLQRERG